jgi:hypothetical protein
MPFDGVSVWLLRKLFKIALIAKALPPSPIEHEVLG